LFAGHPPPVQDQHPQGLQSELKGPAPQSKHTPPEDGGYKIYHAAGKLKDKSCIITGGDSGIGRATAILFAMEGADSLITYLPEEEKDAQETKKQVEGYGRKCYLLATDLTKKKNCKKVVETALKEMGKIDIIFNNAAYQMMVDDIQNLTEYVHELVG
jgi:NAD(P)-dependent dehydrogenase (short-subunit alcohol dehydrogenase family)